VAPGTYYGQLFKQLNGAMSPISEKAAVEVAPMGKSLLPGATPDEVAKFWQELEQLQASLQEMTAQLDEESGKAGRLLKAYERAPQADQALLQDLLALRQTALATERLLYGSKARGEIGEKNEQANVWSYLWAMSIGTSNATYGPTPAHREYFRYAQGMMEEAGKQVAALRAQRMALEGRLKAIGAPSVE
jgi:hypothetical protein